MIRKLLLPALLVGLLGGCVSAGYGYRDGYYYGQPSVEYRYRDYGYPYGYGHYPYRGHYYGYYGYPYYGRYYYPYYYYPYSRPRPPQKPPHERPPTDRPDDDSDDSGRPPWRDLDRHTRRGEITERALRDNVPRPQPTVREDARRQPRSEGSRMGQTLRRATETRRRSAETQEP